MVAEITEEKSYYKDELIKSPSVTDLTLSEARQKKAIKKKKTNQTTEVYTWQDKQCCSEKAGN